MRVLLFIFILSTQFCFAQKNKSLYNKEGQLKSDTTVKITQQQLSVWLEIEENLLSNFYNNFNTPQFFLDASMEFSWIFSFQYDKKLSEFNTVKIHKQLHSKSFPELHRQNKVIADSVKTALNQMKYGSVLYTLNKSNADYTFYLPIVLKVKSVFDTVDDNGVLKINPTSPAFIEP